MRAISLVEWRQRGMGDHLVDPGAENDDQIGVAERVRAHRQIGIGGNHRSCAGGYRLGLRAR
jgi:hypothetical protein